MKRALLFALVSCLLAVNAWAGGSQGTSGVTAQDIIDDIRNDFNEDSGLFTDSEAVQWLDEAVREINYRARCLESGASNIILAANDWDYALTHSYMDIEKVMYDSGVTDDDYSPQVYALDRVPFQKLRYGHEKDRGSPKSWAVWNDTLFIWPVPRSTESGSTLYLYSVETPSGVTVTSSAIETPSYFDEAIKRYVLAKAYYKDRQRAKGNAEMALFRDYISLYVSRWGLIAPAQPPPQ
jgi:hypothetical protein